MGSNIACTTTLTANMTIIETWGIVDQGTKVLRVFSPAVTQIQWVLNSKMRKTTSKTCRKTLLIQKTSSKL